ncbi:tetratricopeptide repeat protein [Nocardia nova]|uniref:tetratricopeptide repeat protein n=1 Tax=Nocardia nova TaxID=37330 RepID=UPI0015E31B99|nr:tetratricopeptide repeat protein [Nocardia nova]
MVIVDYADRWRRENLVDLVFQLASVPDRPVRILLLARPGISFWKHLKKDIPQNVDRVDPFELREFVGESTPERMEAFGIAATAFAKELDIDITGCTLKFDLSRPSFGAPLDLHMAALATVWSHRDGVAPPDRGHLSEYLIDHERRCWGEDLDDQMEQAVIVATLFGPVAGLSRAREIIQAAVLADNDAGSDSVIRTHESKYPQPSGSEESPSFLPPLRPDRFGEDFVSTCLCEPQTRDRVQSLLMNPLVLENRGARQPLTVLSAASYRHDSAAATLLKIFTLNNSLVEDATADCIRIVHERASEGYAEWFLGLLPVREDETAEAAADLALHVAQNIPKHASKIRKFLTLQQVGARLYTAGQLDAAVAPMKESVAIARQLQNSNPRQNSELLADALHGYANNLWDAGNATDAIAPMRESVAIYESLFYSEPDRYQPKLGSGLITLGVILGEGAGDNNEGLKCLQRAVAVIRKVADSDGSDMRSRLALAMHNMSVRLSAVGLYEESLKTIREAVRLRRDLVIHDPRAHTGDYAASLVNLAYALAFNNSSGEAIEAALTALEIRRERFAQSQTEGRRRDLARSLEAVARTLLSARRLEEAWNSALESQSIFRSLAGTDKPYYDEEIERAEDLVRTIRVMTRDRESIISEECEIIAQIRRSGECLSNIQKRRLAHSLLTVAEFRGMDTLEVSKSLDELGEAAGLLQDLFLLHPISNRATYGTVLQMIGSLHRKRGAIGASVESSREAVEILRECKRELDGRTRLAYADASFNLAYGYLEMGRLVEALGPAKEAVEQFQALCDTTTADGLPTVVGSLGVLGTALRLLGRLPEANDVFATAIDLSNKVIEETSDSAEQSTHLRTHSDLLIARAGVSERQDVRGAEKLQGEAITLLRGLVEAAPQKHSLLMAIALINRANNRWSIGLFQDGLADISEAFEVLENIGQDGGEEYYAQLAKAHGTRVNLLRKLGKSDEAMPDSERAVSYYRQLVRACDGKYQRELSITLHNQNMLREDLQIVTSENPS